VCSFSQPFADTAHTRNYVSVVIAQFNAKEDDEIVQLLYRPVYVTFKCLGSTCPRFDEVIHPEHIWFDMTIDALGCK
jgi:hypothetical protein